MKAPPEFQGPPGRVEQEAMEKVRESRSLIWQVNPHCVLPIRWQLWVIMLLRFFRRD